jgi:hypothetical protein
MIPVSPLPHGSPGSGQLRLVPKTLNPVTAVTTRIKIGVSPLLNPVTTFPCQSGDNSIPERVVTMSPLCFVLEAVTALLGGLQ